MLSIEGDHILALIVGFLTRYGEEKLAAKVQAKISNIGGLKDAPLAHKKLEKIIKQYVLQHQQLTQYYQNSPDAGSEDQAEQSPKKRQRRSSHNEELHKESQKNLKASKQLQQTDNKTSKKDPKSLIYSKFSQPKLLESSIVDKSKDKQEEDSEKSEVSEESDKKEQRRVEKIKPKKTSQSKAKTVKKPETDSEEEVESSEDQSEEPERKTKPSQKQKPSKKDQESDSEQQPAKVPSKTTAAKNTPRSLVTDQKPIKVSTTPTQPSQVKPNEYYGQKKFFSRVDTAAIGQLPENLRDNTFEAKLKYGQGDDWGQYGNEKLKNERGEGFKKMKGKLKNKGFQGGTIDPFKVNSISLI